MSFEQQGQNTENTDSTEYIGAASNEFDPNNANCTSKSIDIQSPEDLEVFKDKYKVYNSLLYIATNFSSHINIDGLERVYYFAIEPYISKHFNIIINNSCNIIGISSAILISITYIYVYNQRLLKSISFLQLKNITNRGSIILGNLTYLKSINLPRLKGDTSLSIFNTPKLTKLNLPKKG